MTVREVGIVSRGAPHTRDWTGVGLRSVLAVIVAFAAGDLGRRVADVACYFLLNMCRRFDDAGPVWRNARTPKTSQRVRVELAVALVAV